MTDVQVTNLKKDLENQLKINVTVERIDGTIYFLGSEIDCLRLLRHYRHSIVLSKVWVNYSANLKTWYFALDVAV